jgi:transglutaminase-like putative cysteine protease
MDRISNKNKLLNLIYIIFVFTLAYIVGLGMGLELNISMQILLVLIESVVVKFFLLNPLILYGILAITFISAILTNHYITPFLPDFLERTYFLFKNIVNNLQGKEDIASDNIFLFWIILIALVSFFTSFVLFKSKSIYSLIPIYIGSFVFYWYTFFDEAYWMIAVFLFAFFILLGMNKYSKKLLEIKNSQSFDLEKLYTPWIQTSINYSLLIVILALIIPKGNYYIEWPWLQQKVYSKFPFVEDLRSYDDYIRSSGKAYLFDFSMTGYQGASSRLGGPATLNNKTIMSVYTDKPTYLRGNVRQKYTGNSWESVDTTWENYNLRQDFSGLTQIEKEMYYDEFDITITNHSFSSATLFAPYKPSEIYFNGNHKIKVSADDSIFFSNGVYENESYVVRVQKPLPYGVLVSLGVDLKKNDIENLDTYLQIPDEKITNRTRSLTDKIVKDGKTDFEKAMSIEKYLRNSFNYNTDVAEVPNKQEFIDFFLFDGQEGYCTYYATTMAIMLRLEGIPSRYVEGYLAQDLVEPGRYEVKHRNAHSWVEAFIEPVGWMTFEPTPAYPVEARFEDHNLLTDNSTSPGKVDINDGNSIENNGNRKVDNDLDVEDGKKGSNNELLTQHNTKELSRNGVTIIVGILLLLIPIKFLVSFLVYGYREMQAKKLSNKKKIIYLFKQILGLTELLGYPQKYGETHFDYANRVAYIFSNFEEKGIKEITEIFVKSKYSKSSTSDEDVVALETFKKTMENRLRKYWGPIAYYYRKYIKFGSINN